MITISAYKDQEEALICKALLEAAGVPVTLKDEGGELQLQVRDTDAHLAQNVLIADDSPEWRRRGMRRYYRYAGSAGAGSGTYFLKGGASAVVGVILLLVLLLPLGVTIRLTPFGLLFLFVLGGCVAVLCKSFKIKSKRPTRRIRSV